MKIIIYALLASGVIFGGRKIFRRWVHKQRMRRNDRYKKRLERTWKRRFLDNQREIESGWDKPRHQKVEYRTELARQAEAAFLAAGRSVAL